MCNGGGAICKHVFVNCEEVLFGYGLSSMIICHHPEWGILTYFLAFQHVIVSYFSKSHRSNSNLEEPKPGRPKGQGWLTTHDNEYLHKCIRI